MNKFAEHIKKQMDKKASKCAKVTKKATPLYYPNVAKSFQEEDKEIKVTLKRVDDKNSILINVQVLPKETKDNKETFDGIIRPELNDNRNWKDYDNIEEYLKDTTIYENKEDFKGYGKYIGDTIKEYITIIKGIPALNKQAKKTNKMTKKAFTYEDEKAALAKFLNVKEEDLTKKEENFYFGLPEFTTKNGEEYRISASESVIRGAVAESLENLFNELGLDEFKEKVLPYVGDMERYFSVSESKFYDQAYEELRDVDDVEDPTEEQVEAKQQEIIDSYGSPEEFFIEFGNEYVKEMINYGDASFDFEKMAEDVIDQYGAGHELSSYDNSTEEVEYNGKTYYIFRQAKKTRIMNKKAKSIYDLSAKNAMENENFFMDYLKDNIYGFELSSTSSNNGKKPYEWDVIFNPSNDLLTDKKFTINEKNKDYEIKYYSDEPNGSFLMITFHDINLPILNKVVKYVNRELPELIDKNKKNKVANKKSSKMNKLANIIRKEINKSAGSIDYEVMMDIPKEKIESTKDLVKEIGLKHHIPYTDTITFGETGTITFTLPMEEANELIKELESKGFRLLRREKKDNRTQYEWERDQKVYD